MKLFLQIIVIAVMQQQAKDVASVNHGIDTTFLELLSQPGLHRTQGMKQRHFRTEAGPGEELEGLPEGGSSRATAGKVCGVRWLTS